MTVPQNKRYIRYAPAALSTVMAYNFQIFVEGDIAVARLRAGVPTTLDITTDYTVSGVGVLGGGNITLVVGSVVGDIYAIYGKNEYREADFTQAGDFLASNVNADLNKQMQVSQQLRRDVNTSIRLSPLDSSFDTADLTIPVLADRLDKFLKFNEITGDLEASDGSVNVDGTADQITVIGTTVSIANNPIIPGTTKMRIPSGTTAQRPVAPVNADFRYNSQTNDVEAYVNSTWRSLLNSGSGAPIGSTYITQTSDGTLTNEQALSALATGIMKSTTGTGVVSIDPGITSLSLLATVADRIAYSTALNTWAETPLTPFGRSLIDDAAPVNARTTLGLVIGTDVQAFDATLLSIAALGTAADKIAYTTGVDTWAETPLTAAGRALIDDATAGDQRTTLGLVIGTNVQAFDATLLSIAALGTAADKIAYTTGVDTWAETPLTAAGRALIDDATAGDQRTTLGLVIGTNVQAFDATLLSIAALGTAANKMIYTTGVDTWAEADITAAGRALLDDAAASNQRTTLGLGTMAIQDASAVAITGGTLAGITSAAVGNLNLAANTLSSTNANGNVILDPNGTGFVYTLGCAQMVDEVAAPGTPAGGNLYIYAKADHKLYIKDSTGTETDITTPGAGTAATQAEMETAASTAVFSSPARQQFHPSSVKVWGYVTYSGGVPTLVVNYNVTSFSDTALGKGTANLTTNFSTTNYAASAVVMSDFDVTTWANTGACVVEYNTKAVGSFVVQTAYGGGFLDPVALTFEAQGDQ